MNKKRNRESQNSPGNLRQTQQNGAKSILNFLLDCWFCEICEGVSEDSVIQWMSLVVVSWKLCRGEKGQKRILCFNCKRSCFFDIAPFLRISTKKKETYKLMYGDTGTFFSHLIAFSRTLLPNCELQISVLPCYTRKKNHTYIFDYNVLFVTLLVTDK